MKAKLLQELQVSVTIMPSASGATRNAFASITGMSPEPLGLLTSFKMRWQRMEDVMDWDRIAGNWKQMTGKVKEKWGQLTDDELTEINGDREQLEGILQKRYGLAKDKAREEVDSWSSTL